MRGTDYFKDRLPLLMLQSFAMILLALFVTVFIIETISRAARKRLV